MKNLLKLFIAFSLFIFTSSVIAENYCLLKFDVNKYETTLKSYDEIELPINEFEYLKFDVNEWTNSINSNQKEKMDCENCRMHREKTNHKEKMDKNCNMHREKMNYKNCKMNHQQKPEWNSPPK